MCSDVNDWFTLCLKILRLVDDNKTDGLKVRCPTLLQVEGPKRQALEAAAPEVQEPEIPLSEIPGSEVQAPELQAPGA